jgi:tRNA dimethylallyltransferase
MPSNKIIFIVGPTAVGKSDVACAVAKKVYGEIVSCDSMQIYKEIAIANNKPSRNILQAIPHHLVDILSVQEEFDVARFNELALRAIQDIHGRGRVPVIVGGSGLYMQVLLDGIFEGGVKNEALRQDLKEQARQYGKEILYGKLTAADPLAAGRIHPHDVRRVVRALEICMTENIPISELQKDREGLWGRLDISLFALNRNRDELYARNNKRVEEMFRQGIIDEIRALESVPWSKTAHQMIGVQEVTRLLRSECSLEEAKEAMKMNSRRLAKRQLTWFRRDKRLEWVTVTAGEKPEHTAEAILNRWYSLAEAGKL